MVIVLAICFTAVRSYFDSSELTLKVKDTKTISLYSADDVNKKIRSFDGSGTYRVRDGSYVIKYTGDDGFAGGEKRITLDNENQKVVITPEFSASRLNTILDKEIVQIHSALNKQVERLGIYQIQRGALYKYGDWYGTTLVYNGNDEYNADMLRLVMKKDGDTWKMVTKTPSIHINKFNTPDTPDDVLDRINGAPVIIQERFSDT